MAKKVTTKTAAKPKATKPKTKPAAPKGAPFTLAETLRELKAMGNEGTRAQNAKDSPFFGKGAGDNQFGVSRGDVRKLAAKIKTNHELALSLWNTGNIDAQFLAALIIKVDLPEAWPPLQVAPLVVALSQSAHRSSR
jgi:hypothetical protein